MAAKWNKATYDPQEPHFRTYELEEWQIKLDDTTILETLKSNNFKKEISEFEKARKTKRQATFIECFEDISGLSNNDRIHFNAYLVGGIGMKRPQRNGDFFKILLTNNKSESMPVVYIFNHNNIHELLSQNISATFKFENFRVSVHHGIKGIVSTDDSSEIGRAHV